MRLTSASGIAAVAATIVFISSPQSTQAEDKLVPQPVDEVATDVAIPPEWICKVQRQLGSKIPRRVCYTPQQWEAKAAEGKRVRYEANSG